MLEKFHIQQEVAEEAVGLLRRGGGDGGGSGGGGGGDDDSLCRLHSLNSKKLINSWSFQRKCEVELVVLSWGIFYEHLCLVYLVTWYSLAVSL